MDLSENCPGQEQFPDSPVFFVRYFCYNNMNMSRNQENQIQEVQAYDTERTATCTQNFSTDSEAPVRNHDRGGHTERSEGNLSYGPL